MKKQCLTVLAVMAEKAIKQANSKASRFWSYQPKAPEGIKDFKK
ncbi:cyclic lactone autoinducer peptide [Anaerocolumna sp. AGMB13025]